MLNRFFGNNTHTYLHLFGLSAVAIGIPLNKIVMSLGMMFVVLNLLLEGDFKSYFKNLKTNKAYLLILGFFLLHVVSILWTSNFDYFFNDLRVKLPILILPTVIVAKPILDKFYLKIILWCISTSTIIVSFINYLTYQQVFGEHIYDDIRGMSLFSSHVRLAIIISIVIVILVSFLKRKKNSLNILLIVLILWLTYYTIYSQVLSGILTLFTGLSTFIIIKLWDKRKWLLIPTFSIPAFIILSLLIWVFSPVEINRSDYKKLVPQSENGNDYKHEFLFISPVNNQPTHLYVCNIEIDNGWKHYSKIPIDSIDQKGQPIKETLIRYMFSKNLRKDSVGLTQLSQTDILRIEQGISSERKNNLLSRLYGVKYQIINSFDPNGHSILQRMEFWKTGWQIATKNFIIGTGSGDVQDEFDKQYIINNSQLRIENQKRAHNYFLSTLLTFGIIGLLYFLWTMLYFIRVNFENKTIIGLVFMVIILTSFLVEDTIETQTGITLFGLFFGLFSLKKEDSIKLE